MRREELIVQVVKGASDESLVEICAAYAEIGAAYRELKNKSVEANKVLVMTAGVIAYLDIISDWLVFRSFYAREMYPLQWLCLGSILAPAALLAVLATGWTVSLVHVRHHARGGLPEFIEVTYTAFHTLWLWKTALFTAVLIEPAWSMLRAIKAIDAGNSPTQYMDILPNSDSAGAVLEYGGMLAILKGLEMVFESVPQTMLQTYAYLIEQDGERDTATLVFSIVSGVLATSLTFATLVMIEGVGKENWVSKMNGSVWCVLEAIFCAAADSIVHVIALSFFAYVWLFHNHGSGHNHGLLTCGAAVTIMVLIKIIFWIFVNHRLSFKSAIAILKNLAQVRIVLYLISSRLVTNALPATARLRVGQIARALGLGRVHDVREDMVFEELRLLVIIQPTILTLVAVQETLITLPLEAYGGKGFPLFTGGKGLAKLYVPPLVALAISVVETWVLLLFAYFPAGLRFILGFRGEATLPTTLQRRVDGLPSMERVLPLMAACTLVKVFVFCRMEGKTSCGGLVSRKLQTRLQSAIAYVWGSSDTEKRNDEHLEKLDKALQSCLWEWG